MKYIYELHKTMVERSLILVYEGEFTQEITKSVLAMAERNMDAIGESSSIKRKVFNVMVECLQNIVKHAEDSAKEEEEFEPPAGNAVFMIGQEEDKYIITSGNPVANDKVEILQEKLDHINSLDKDGLKALYKDIIKKGRETGTGKDGLSPKGGAGLGFVDMARKSGQKLHFDFEPIDDHFSFFSLKTIINRNKEEKK
ncbi:hypothetical protein BKI52_36400 [marine bacterium AO1-C]|nr:hypothetical protein BKI52_36400 [marine bacterium AO1-C]